LHNEASFYTDFDTLQFTQFKSCAFTYWLTVLNVPVSQSSLELHLTTSELWFGQEQEGILP